MLWLLWLLLLLLLLRAPCADGCFLAAMQRRSARRIQGEENHDPLPRATDGAGINDGRRAICRNKRFLGLGAFRRVCRGRSDWVPSLFRLGPLPLEQVSFPTLFPLGDLCRTVVCELICGTSQTFCGQRIKRSLLVWWIQIHGGGGEPAPPLILTVTQHWLVT